MARPASRRAAFLTKTGLADEVLTTDAKVIAALARNARPTYDELIEATGVPRRTLQGSLQRLREAGMVDYADRLNGTIHATFGLVVGVPR